MASGKNAKKSRAGSAPVIRARQGLPWLTIAAVVAVLALVAAIFTFVYSKQHSRNVAADAAAQQAAALKPWQPTTENKDPSTAIPGIYVAASVTTGDSITYPKYKAALHVSSTQRVAYDRFPPVGGPHDAEWAACNGIVYDKAVRDENMVHTLEHGTVWIAYNPAKLAAGDLDKLKAIVTGQTYLTLSPYPTLDQPISLQSWGHQLKVDSASDPRVQQFITALRENPFITPEVNGSCDQPSFIADPPAFDSSPRGSDAIPLDGSGLATATDESGMSGAASGAQVSPSVEPSAVVSSGGAVTTAASSN